MHGQKKVVMKILHTYLHYTESNLNHENTKTNHRENDQHKGSKDKIKKAQRKATINTNVL